MDDAAVQPDQPDDQVQAPDAPMAGRRASKQATQYQIGAVAPVEPAFALPTEGVTAAAPEKRVAVFVAHGMGQQIPFQTLDQVAQGLLAHDSSDDPSGGQLKVRAVKFDDQWLHRIELKLRAGTADAVEVHVYEGYWAPLTEGKITARNVMDFLVGAARNGIKVGSREFSRWIFDGNWKFDSPVRIIFYLLIALMTVASLMAINSTIAVVVAARALLARPPDWLTAALLADLTTTFNIVLLAMAVFGGSLGFSGWLRKRRAPAPLRRGVGGLAVVLFVTVLFVIVLAGLSLAFLFYGHVKRDGASTPGFWKEIFPAELVTQFDLGFGYAALGIAVVAAAGFLLMWVLKIAGGIWRDLGDPRQRWPTLLVTAGAAALGVLAVWLAFALFAVLSGLPEAESGALVRGGVVWALLVAASAFVRKMLVQYVGDVAIYVAPYKLDAFFQLRDQIKDCVYKVAQSVYGRKRSDGSHEYDQVLVVGHSLGSVIVYDALNRLINEDENAGGTTQVADRTPLLLTFGSPLDKTAFLFAVQAQDTKEAREALAATAQPLIQDYKFRPARWINIYSPWDIISGPLDFYDVPGLRHSKRVENQPDPDATTLLAAHVEYWSNPLLFKTLLQHL